MSIPSTGLGRRKLTSRAMSLRYGVSGKTIDRWTEDGILPSPMRINNVRYWDEEEVDQRDRERMTETGQPAAA
jgi:predicted DNA-binding transcriptional regulator AlpA